MPIECFLLRDTKVPFEICPKCSQSFEPFMRGLVQRSKLKWWIGPKRDYCALICSHCKNIVGYESPMNKTTISFEIKQERYRKLFVFGSILIMILLFIIVWLSQ